MFHESSAEGWSRLALYTSREILERKYRERHGGELSAGKAREIIAHLEQARQYFESAESAGVLAGPLEQYYGVLAFSRAIILLRNRGAREATLTKGHGLSASLPGDAGIDQLELQVSAGTFLELLDATANAETLVIRDATKETLSFMGDVLLTQALPRPPVESRFSFLDLLARTPQLARLFGESLGTRPNSYECHVLLWGKAVNVELYPRDFKLPSPGELVKSLCLSGDVAINQRHEEWVAGHTTLVIPVVDGEVTSYGKLPHIRLDHVIDRYAGGWSLSRLGSYFAGSHALSALVRYYPTRWAELVNHQRDDRLLPVIGELRRLIQLDFVSVALEELER